MSNVSPSDGGYSYYQHSIDDLEDDIRSDAKNREEKRQEALETQAKHHDEELRRKDEQHAEQIAKVRDDAYERIQDARQNAREEIADAKAQTYDRYGRLYEQTQKDREDAHNAIERAKQEYDTAAARDKTNQSRYSDGALQEQMRRQTADAETLRNSHARETGDLRRQLQDVSEEDRKTLHGYNEGHSAAIRDFENDYRDKARIQQDATTAELAATRERGRQVNRYYNEENDRNLKEQGMSMTRMLNQQTDEAHRDRRQLEDQFMLDHDQSEVRARKDREYSQRQLEDRMDQAAVDRNRALDAQAKAYGESYDNLSKASSEKEGRLQAALQEQRTTADASQISPAAEQSVREATANQYEKTFSADDKRKRAEIESLKQNFRDRYTDLLDDKRQNDMRMSQNQALQQHQDQAAYIDSVTEVSNDRDESLRDKDAEHQRSNDALTHDHVRVLDQQRREYEDIIQNIKNDSNSRIGTMRQDYEFNSKMAQKTFSASQNELIRDYEKKLADQKQDYESQLGDVKSELALTQRESERRTRQSLEDQSKGYEQRIAQTEFQNKERERLISQNYQDELEKVKRSNALLIQKKS